MVLRAVESGQEDILYDHIVIFCEDLGSFALNSEGKNIKNTFNNIMYYYCMRLITYLKISFCWYVFIVWIDLPLFLNGNLANESTEEERKYL